MAWKMYAIRKGRKTGIVYSWADCKASIDKFPGQDYKGFNDKKSAEEYLAGGDGVNTEDSCDSAESVNKKSNGFKIGLVGLNEIEKYHNMQGTAVCYIDGSYKDGYDGYSYGGVFIANGIEQPFKWREHDITFLGKKLDVNSRNVIGELSASCFAMFTAMKFGFKELVIVHDYNGVRNFITGEFDARSQLAKEYLDFYVKNVNSKLNVSFCKVKGHSGNKYNEWADELAANALYL